MIYTIYDPTNGQILYAVSGVGISLDNQLIGQTYIEGNYNDRDHYIDLATKIAIAKPLQPSIDHIWNVDAKSWQLDVTLAAANARSKRNSLLSAIDRINPVWYSTLSQEQTAELTAYRQALLDVPQQSGFPETITWLDKPQWL